MNLSDYALIDAAFFAQAASATPVPETSLAAPLGIAWMLAHRSR